MDDRIEHMLTIKEVCARLNVSKHTVYLWMKSSDPSERLPAYRLPGGRTYRVREKDLEGFWKRFKITPEHDLQDDEGDE